MLLRRPRTVTTALACAVLAALPHAAVAQGDRLADGIDAVFAQFDRPGSPGCAVGVVQDGELTFSKGYGYAHLDWDIPITPKTVFYVGSVSKQFTAAAVALLDLEGKLSLDDDIRRLLPEMPAYDPAVTIRHLVHHTSGVKDMYAVMRDNGESPANLFTREEALALLAQQELAFTPGERYQYSNGGYFLLSMIVQRASGQTLREYTRSRMFEPLGMHDTHFHDTPGHIVERRAMSYMPRDGGGYEQSYLNNFALPGAGGLYTTVEDLVQWDRNFYENRLLDGSDDFIDLTLSRGVLNSGEMLDYAFALRDSAYRGLRSLSHSGSFMGFKAFFLRFPDQRFSSWALCNLGTIDPGELIHKVADLYLENEMTE